ncbi:hypothetical protein HBI56_058930 [Parastagonospora nodorum]|nr:hypothetical protein HBH50_174730 [Parastagonospora nodorum]KAH4083910.1 hypothetical protein HBH48_172330 [Parastagonospora nodorum]KAH4257997.1 hypothetical protein HBI03_148780 [Parastagonospora nodorum]KAH4277354.1 hypothetical protein HBI04_093440 [Parastagonospora nodorum]KAH4347200.1 hypothetical protein HBH98_090460 [Parastagonospora nodorum]
MAATTISPPTNHQMQSPLFGLLPGEIRNEIFALALMPYEDEAATYPKDSYWYRPGFSAPRKSNSVLLRTCKAAYAEGQKVFLRDLEWAFWFDRGPDGRSGNRECARFFRELTPQAVEALQKVRFFTQMYWLEGGSNLLSLFRNPQFRPTQLTITIRYSDWWWWEDDAPLTMEEGWLRTFNGTPGLRELRVEYETRVPKKAEMMRIVERNKKWKLPVRRAGGELNDWEGYLSAETTKLKEWTWKGTSKLGGREWGHLAKSDTVEYVVVTDTWIFVEQSVTPEDLGREATSSQYRELGEDEQDDLHYVYGDYDDFDGFGVNVDYDGTDEEDEEGMSEYEDEDAEGDDSEPENLDGSPARERASEG